MQIHVGNFLTLGLFERSFNRLETASDIAAVQVHENGWTVDTALYLTGEVAKSGVEVSAGALVTGSALGKGGNVLSNGARAIQEVRAGQKFVTKVKKNFTESQVPQRVRDQVPREWRRGGLSRESDGWIWKNLKNHHESIRYHPGEPKADYSSRRNPYIKRTNDGGHYLDKFGKEVQGYGNMKPYKTPEAHIPVNDFNFLP